MTIEYRNFRAAKPGESDGKLHGRAAPFNSETTIGGSKWGFREKISPTAFDQSIKDGDIVLLDNHDMAKPIARQSAGTFRPVAGKDGCDWDADPADTTYARDAVENARAGNYGGCSFGFEVIKDSWKRGEDGELDLRTLEEVKVHEISVCTFPAYGDTDVQARSREQASLEAARESREMALGPIDVTDSKDETDEERKDAKKPYGDVAYADPKNGKYPIDSKAHAKAAWDYINVESNASKYPLNGVSLASVKARIKAACKKFGITVSEKNAELDLDLAELRVLALLLAESDSLSDEERDMYVAALRDEAPAADPYDDEFYTRADKDEENKSDASDADEGNAKNNCNTCDGTGKDKSGNQCAACGGSGHKNGDGKTHESGAGDEKKNEDTSDAETRSEKNGESGSARTTDPADANRRMKAAARRARMRMESR